MQSNTTNCQGCAVQQGTHVPMGSVTQISEPTAVQATDAELVVKMSRKIAALEEEMRQVGGRLEHGKQLLREEMQRATERGEEALKLRARIAELEAQLAAAQQGVPEGWALVPKTPTAEQLRAGYWSGGGEIRLHEEWARRESYERMVQNAPKPPATHPTTQGLEQDAARYRWLREQHDKGDDSVTIFIGDEQHGPGHLDAQVDEAIAAQAKRGEQAHGITQEKQR